MSSKRSFPTTTNNFKKNEDVPIDLSEEFSRFENQRNSCELLLQQGKLLELFYSHTQMNDLQILVRFFRFLQQSMIRTRSNASKLILRLPGSKVLSFAYGYLKPSPTMDDQEKKLLEEFVLILISVLQSLLELHPHCWEQIDSSGLFDRLERYNQQHSNAEVELAITTLLSVGDGSRERVTKKQQANSETNVDHDDPPPDDFHKLSIYPTLAEIFQPQIPYLRKNITAGQYKNGTHYLDIHFRLLREDFLGPLREAICQYMSEDSRDSLFRNANVRVYRNTILTGSICSNAGILFSMTIDPSTLPKSINWANSRRLIYGNLLAATFDNFATSCFLLTVEDRSNVDKDGTLSVRCQKELCESKLMRIAPGTSFTLLETTSYFEAYRPILQALQHIPDDRLPLEEYLLHCDKNVDLPNYFKEKSEIDFRQILVTKGETSSPFLGEMSNVKDISTWPNAEQLGLDDSQYKALELAMTKSLALIQGPPGCGKTFLGVRLAELFYHNRHRIDGCKRPILMICYTNHALDQFLSAIISKLSLQPGQVVRVGGRSTNPAVEPFLIQKLRHQKRIIRSRNEDLSTKYEILNVIRKQIDECQMKYYECSSQLLDANQLLEVIDRRQFLTLIEPILSKLDIYNGHWESNKGGVYCCRSKQTAQSDEDDDSDESSSEKASEEDNDDGEELSAYERAARMKNRIHCRKLNDLTSDDQNEIKQLLIKWLDSTQIELIRDQIREQNEDDGDGEFQQQRRKHKRKMKDKATEVLREILNDPISSTTRQQPVTNDENAVNLEEDEEESRRLENVDNSYMPFNMPNPANEKTKHVDIEQLEYMQRLLYNKAAFLSDDAVGKIKDLWSNSVDREQRQALYRYWLGKYAQLLTEKYYFLNEQYDENHQSMQALWLSTDQVYMDEAFIIAMTTHCASRYQKVLKDIGPKICIVEEAAEVFESHIVTAIGDRVEHLILIGDHVQLRPSPNVYTLAKNFNLDVSLFERLIKNDMPSIQLCVQHRSIPIISNLTHHFYDIPILNHSSVLNRRSIIGVTHPLYFIYHNHFEENVADGASKRNTYECNYVLQLASYLLNQGYDKSQITILTTYMGQRQLIQRTINQHAAHLRGIHVTVVDNFQGEENRIVLLSLVRSNADKRLGYIGVDNRICVALSRAKDGFYVIGNFTLLVEQNETWKTIVNKLKKSPNLIGPGLPIHCANHPDNQAVCTHPNDFLKRPIGGCGLECDTRLACGHQCSLTCHSTSHESLICHRLCLKKYQDCEHQCEKKCHAPKDCPPCYEVIKLKMIDCEHTTEIPCVMRKTNQLQCQELVPYSCPNGHQVQVRCYELKKDELRDQLCNQPCDFTLECGHRCKGSCSGCFQGRLHRPCGEEELIVYVCGHSRRQRCHELGPRCEQPYFKLCDHNDEPRALDALNQCIIHDCKRFCQNRCRHLRCGQRCNTECDRSSCNEKCSRRFACEHYCNAICGEPCIDCLRCRGGNLPDEIRRVIQVKSLRYATFVELECGHLFETGMLDAHVKVFQEKCFPSNGFAYVDYPRCPTCQSPIVKCKRYVSLTKKIQNRMENLDSITSTPTTLLKNNLISDRMKALEDIVLPEKIMTIAKISNDAKRQRALTELFANVIKLFQKMSSRVEIERDQFLKCIYERIEERNSIFFTRQEWSDLEHECNRLMFIDRFRLVKELLGVNFEKTALETLNEIFFGSNTFSKLSCEVCSSLLKENGMDDDYQWKSILPDETKWTDFEKDRLLCDGKWCVCPKGEHMIWCTDTLSDKSKCVQCVVGTVENSRTSSGRGRGYPRGGGFRRITFN